MISRRIMALLKIEKIANPINLLKGMAAIMVVWWHFMMAYPPVFLISFRQINLSWIISLNAATGVWIFFILSGFLIGKGFASHKYQLTFRGIFRFYYNRIITIVPFYYLIILYLCLSYGNRQNITFNYVKYFLTFIGTSQIQTEPLGYLWFVSVIMQLYLLSPLFYFILSLILKAVKSKYYLCLGVFLYFLTVIYLTAQHNPLSNYGDYNAMIYPNLFVNSGFFMFGMYLNFFFIKKPHDNLTENNPGLRRRELLYYASIVSIFLLICFSSFINHYYISDFADFRFMTLYFMPIFTCFSVGLFLASSGLNNPDHHRIIKRIFIIPVYLLGLTGSASYIIYLIQYPVFSVFGNLISPYDSLWNFFHNEMIMIAVCLLIAVTVKITAGKLTGKMKLS
jgi:peptidoglycan/LPS O-acetylase OafA/YrhL